VMIMAEIKLTKGEAESLLDFLECNLIDCIRSDMEGRLIVLPCKVGDTVYYIPSYAKKIYSGICHCISIHSGGIQVHLYDVDGDNVSLSPKRVFRTREEAEAALERSKSDGT